jgi:hypothetical protein
MKSRADVRQMAVFASLNLVILTAILAARLLMPSAIAPRVNVRWVAGTSDSSRMELEERFRLRASQYREGTTWTYDLVDPSPANVTALVQNPSVEDTYHINRTRGVMEDDAPRGTSFIVGASRVGWVQAEAGYWIMVFCLSSLVVSSVWLVLCFTS